MNPGTPVPVNEIERLLSLSNMDLDYTSLQNSLEDLTRLAAGIAGTTISLVNLIDTYNQWSVSRFGIEIEQMPREDSVCQYTIMEDQYLEVPNLATDERFKNKSYVTSGPLLQYYFGVPLKTEKGMHIGALCVLDKQAKLLDPAKAELLKLVAKEIVVRLTSEKNIEVLNQKLTDMTETQERLAHDIRGPIGGMIGLAQLFSSPDCDTNPEEMAEVFSMIESGGQSILTLAEDILNHAKVNASHAAINNDQYNLQSFKQAIEKLYQPMAKHKNILFIVKAGVENSSILFSKNKLMQVCGNLISNAIKFTPAGGTVTVTLQLDTYKWENKLQICVEDTGVGMSAKAVTDIMSGIAVSTNGTEGEHGYGLGLSLVKHLVDDLDGTMQVYAVEGEGTKFEISLPQKNEISQLLLQETGFSHIAC